MSVSGPTIHDTMSDPRLFGRWFEGESWSAWRAFLGVLFGLPVSGPEVELARGCTGRQRVLDGPAREAWLIVGRRGGKSRIAALVAVYLACFRDYRERLAPGERATLMVIAADRRQARVVFRYVSGLLDGVPMLAAKVVRRTREAIDLDNGVTIEVHTASFRAVRGYTIVGAIADEVAFWRSEESANPDVEILTGLRPGMATVPGAVLLGISSPYARRGALWTVYKRHWGHDDDPVLVWQADTATMNPGVDADVIAEAYAQDETAAASEYGATFRRDLEDFIAREALDAVVVPDRAELPPAFGPRYVGFVDPSGGARDSMTLAIAHYAPGRHGAPGHTVLDVLRERRPPFSPADVVQEFATVLRAYRVTRVTGDRYAGEWARERFREAGVAYAPAELAKSELYLELLPAIHEHRVELLDHARLLAQLQQLERRTSRVGRDTVDHGPGGHDDVANAAAGAVVLAARAGRRSGLRPAVGGVRVVDLGVADPRAVAALPREF